MKCSWKWLQWGDTCEMYMCRWGLEICLCFQKDLEIHLYPEEESKTMLKPDLVNTTKLIGFFHCCFFQELNQTCLLFTSSKACFCHGTAGIMGGSRIGKDRDLAHSTPSHSRQKKWPGSTKNPATKPLLRQVQGQARTSCQDQQVRKPRETGLPTAELSQGPRARTWADRELLGLWAGGTRGELQISFGAIPAAWGLLEWWLFLWLLFSGSKKVGMVQYSAVFSSTQTRQLWVSSLYSHVSASFKCSLIL